MRSFTRGTLGLEVITEFSVANADLHLIRFTVVVAKPRYAARSGPLRVRGFSVDNARLLRALDMNVTSNCIRSFF